MIKKAIYYLGYVAMACALVSCGQSAEEINGLLARAAQQAEQHPDSALFYLNAIRNPARLNKEQYGDYHLLRIQAKDKAGHDIGADTVICDVKNYFLRKKNFEKATLAAFYEGFVFSNDNKRALQALLDAETFAEHISDAKRKGLIQHNIGWLYYAGGTDYKEAVVRFKQAAGYFRAGNYYKYRIAALNLLGTCFLIQEQADSALFYQQQAIDIAIANRDTTAWGEILQNISVTCREAGDNLNAKTYALQAIQLSATAEQEISAILNLASIYYNSHQNDSAAFYANKLLQIPDKERTPSTLVSVYTLLAKIEKADNNYQKALEYHEEYSNQMAKIYAEKEKQSIAGMQEKYELELVKTDNQTLLIERLVIFIIASLIVLFLIGGVFFLYYRNSRQKIKLLQIEREHNKLHSSHTDFYKKAGRVKKSLQTIVGNDELLEKIYHKISQIFYDTNEPLTWEGLYPALNRQYNGLFDRMRQQFPQLSDMEFKICCLEYAGFRNKEIADYVHLKLDTVQSKKSAIRKTLGISPKDKIRKFLTGKLNK